MNASALSLGREGEIQSKIGKIRAFGRIARVPCGALFAFGMVGVIGMMLVVLLGPIHGSDGGSGLPGLDGVTAAQLTTPALKAWALLVMGVVTSTSLAAVYQIYRLFGSLAAGAIYTIENVRRVRHIGLLTLLSAVLGIAIPVASAALVSFGYFDASGPIHQEFVAPSQQWWSAIISAGLILLASWIMDVGLYEKDHADALQRDADLVI